MKKNFALSLLMIFIVSLFTGCKKDKGDPPVLPPIESMAIDFSNFEAGKKSADISLQKGDPDNNWKLVCGVANFWRNIIVTTLAVPVLSFKLAVDETPVYLDDKTWQWTYSTSYSAISYTARLTGQIRSSDVLWKMYITRTGVGGFSEFLWFQGTSKLDGTGGQWILNQSSADQVPILQIDWTRTGTTMGNVTYTYVKEKLADGVTANPFNSSFITYGKTTSTLDAFYTIHYYYNTLFADFSVEWSTSARNGRVKSPGVFGDSVWHCWDINYYDVTCPL
ncbi:MAG: hypothetical protein MUC93_00380 [Bacteroidales bacterium]|jgi:hypothetical protein|nr:hypothetical protein [Bacteroidales bacterium]